MQWGITGGSVGCCRSFAHRNRVMARTTLHWMMSLRTQSHMTSHRTGEGSQSRACRDSQGRNVRYFLYS